MNWQEIESSISAATEKQFKVLQARSVGGGSINSAYKLSGEHETYFVKVNDRIYSDMFAAETEGLAELARPAIIRVPTPVCWGESSVNSFIVMEEITVSSGDKYSAARFGEQLAGLHQTHADVFGWHRDNTIGSTAQVNKQNKNWLDFYREQRLQFQLSLAVSNGCSRELTTLGERLNDSIEAFFQTYDPRPSLLHGDLWSGNYAYDENARPVIFDPAVYYGDREADIAMTEFFGGFSHEFYAAYNAVYPLDEGYHVRKTLYNLYHVLNHFNLFGGGYQRQAIEKMRHLLTEI